MWEQARWIGIPQSEIKEKKIYAGDLTGRFAYYRCEKELPAGCTLTANITANSRYRLWVNGEPVLSGPCKGDRYRQYYETVDLSSYLQEGKNEFCVQVLYLDPDAVERQTDERASIYGVIGRQCGHRLAVEGRIADAFGKAVSAITTGEADWSVWLDGSFYLKSAEVTQFLGAVMEEIDFSQSPVLWKTKEFDASGWKKAAVFSKVNPKEDPLHRYTGIHTGFRLREREIPLLYEEPDCFVEDFFVSNKNTGKTTDTENDKAEAGLLKQGKLELAPGEGLELVLDAGVIKNGYLRYSFQGGQGRCVSMTYFEKFGGAGSNLVRTDRSGKIEGLTDTIRLNGEAVCYEPFWVRCFRFVRIRVEVGEAPLTVYAPVFRRTGYPLKVESEISSSASWVGSLWDICVRTLENCMMETYMDCPYYEQLQFAMDTRLEALYTYVVSGDARLAKKALIDFHYGMQPEGLTAGKYPSVYLQVLSTFSLHYVYMLWEYYVQTGDRDTILLCRGDIDRIFEYYDARIQSDGMVGRLDFWEFVDWLDEWGDTQGTPAALEKGPSTIVNLMYAYALDCGSRLMEATGRSGLALEYRKRREQLLAVVRRLCWDEEAGLYREGPEFSQFSRHAQAWAVRNGLAEGDEAEKLLSRAIQREDCLKCTFSTSYEWFQALAQAGMYRQMRQDLEDWIGLLELGCTTCPETPQNARSDCHAWSALPMYLMIRTMAGIRMDEMGEGLVIEPHLMGLPDLKGNAVTKWGILHFHYLHDETGVLSCRITLPKGARGVFVYQDDRNGKAGRTTELLEGEHVY